jgi:hypothetical protein
MEIRRTQLGVLVENQLPDGSRVIVNSSNEKVFALNATAGAAWDACATQKTLAGVTEEMRRLMGDTVTETIAAQAICQLQQQNLVTMSGSSGRTRREIILGIGAVALPLVVGLTVAEQRAYAKSSGSWAPPSPPKPTSPPPPPPPTCGIVCQILQGLGL